MDSPQVEQQIEALQAADLYVRLRAVEALGNLGNASAVPGIVRALRDEDRDVRLIAAKALGKIGSPAAVPALISTLRDENASVCHYTAEALGKIGVAAVPAVVQALMTWEDREFAVKALNRIGDAQTLPRKILAASEFSAQKRIEILDALRHVTTHSIRSHYHLPDTRSLCLMVLNEPDSATRAGAQTVLNWLDGDCQLVIASHRSPEADSQELVRPSHGETP